MNTDDMLVEQAARNKAQNPSAKVFVYRNIVKVTLSPSSLTQLLSPLQQLYPTPAGSSSLRHPG